MEIVISALAIIIPEHFKNLIIGCVVVHRTTGSQFSLKR